LAAIPGVKSVAEQIGRSENGQDPDARNKSEFGIQLDPARSVSTEQLDARVRTLFDLGGLVSSTLVALVLVPPLAARWLRQG
jgi:Cu/Ag efflux pump CusA